MNTNPITRAIGFGPATTSRRAAGLLAALLVAGVALLAALPAAQAQTVKMYSEADQPSAEEIAAILANSLRSRTRGVRLSDASRPAAGSTLKLTAPTNQQPPVEPAAGEPDAFSLPVRFAFDSAQLSAVARPQLDRVAEAMKLLDGQIVLLIEGHTDAHGAAAHNLSLSQRRAAAVRRYLIEQHGIDAELIDSLGKGASDPINPANPFAGENRRVQFRAG
jgi:outer membrane protein OmpA-like peptidoglycan-associated protein